MAEAQTVEFQLSMTDPEASAEELRGMVQFVAAELEGQGALVAAAPSSGQPGRVAKGGGTSGSILNVEINLENILAFGRWLRRRIAGTPTKAKFEFSGAVFEFEGQDEQQLAAAMAGFEQFVATVAGRSRLG